MTTASTAPPREVRAGDTVSWRRSLPQFPADAGWSLSVALISASAVITLAATAPGFRPATFRHRLDFTQAINRTSLTLAPV